MRRLNESPIPYNSSFFIFLNLLIVKRMNSYKSKGTYIMPYNKIIVNSVLSLHPNILYDPKRTIPARYSVF